MIMILIENDNFFILQKIKAPIFSISALIKKYKYKNLVRLEGLEPPSSDFVVGIRSKIYFIPAYYKSFHKTVFF